MESRPDAEMSSGEAIGKLSDRELCIAWQRGYMSLQLAASLEQRCGIVVERQSCLDEVERRQPDTFVPWLETKSRPDSDPEKYFTPRAKTITGDAPTQRTNRCWLFAAVAKLLRPRTRAARSVGSNWYDPRPPE